MPPKKKSTREFSSSSSVSPGRDHSKNATKRERSNSFSITPLIKDSSSPKSFSPSPDREKVKFDDNFSSPKENFPRGNSNFGQRGFRGRRGRGRGRGNSRRPFRPQNRWDDKNDGGRDANRKSRDDNRQRRRGDHFDRGHSPEGNNRGGRRFKQDGGNFRRNDGDGRFGGDNRRSKNAFDGRTNKRGREEHSQDDFKGKNDLNDKFSSSRSRSISIDLSADGERDNKRVGGGYNKFAETTSNNGHPRDDSNWSGQSKRKRSQENEFTSYEEPKREPEGEKDTKGKILSYKDFLIRQRDDITPEEAQKLYDQYKKEHQLSNTKVFFDRHKDEEWFREKYCPSVRLEVFKKQLKVSEENSKKVFQQVRAILAQPETEREPSLQSFIAENQLDRDRDAYELIRELERKVDIEDEAEKAREVERLLLEERQKEDQKNESESGEEDNLADSAQKGDAPLKKDGNSAFSASFGRHLSSLGRNIAKKSQRRVGEDSLVCDENCVFVSTIPLKVRRSDLEDVFAEVDGFQKMCVSEPIPKYNMNRFAWVTFDSQKSCIKALQLNGHKINYSEKYPPLYLHILPKKKSSKSVVPAPFTSLLEKRVESDIKQAIKIIQVLNERKIIDEKIDEEVIDLFDSKIVLLNFLLFYLRFAHFFCYYCGTDYLSEEGLMSRCTKNHPRNSIAKMKTSFLRFTSNEFEDENSKDYSKWLEDLDNKVNTVLETDRTQDILNWKERKSNSFYAENSEIVSKERHRCNLCKKLFLGSEYLKKHISNKHAETLQTFLVTAEDADFFESYASDSNRFLLEHVEAVIPGDTTSYHPTPFFANSNSNYKPSQPSQNPRYPSTQRNFHKRPYSFNRRPYVDLDKPPGEGELEIDYGFASGTTPMFQL